MTCRGDAFHTIDLSGESGGHPWFVITSHDENNEVVIVMMTKHKAYLEQTTIYTAGEHEFITTPSLISYIDMRMEDADSLDIALNNRRVRRGKSCSSALLKKIKDGALQRRDIRPKFRDAIEKDNRQALGDTGALPKK